MGEEEPRMDADFRGSDSCEKRGFGGFSGRPETGDRRPGHENPIRVYPCHPWFKTHAKLLLPVALAGVVAISKSRFLSLSFGRRGF